MADGSLFANDPTFGSLLVKLDAFGSLLVSEDAFGSLLAAWAFEVYENPKKDFTKYTEIVDDNYEVFAKQMIHEENNKAQA